MAYVGLLLAVVADNALRLLPEGFLLRTAPSLPLMTALYVGFRARDTRPLGLAVVLGLLADSFSPSRPLGHFAFLYGAAAYFALRLRRFVPSDHYTSHAVACLVAGFLTALLALLVAAVTVDGPLLPGFVQSLLRALSSALAAPFVFGLWDRSRLFRRDLRGTKYEFA